MARRSVWVCALALWTLGMAGPALGQAPPDSDFAVVTLAKGADKTGEPIAMAVLPDGRVLHTSRDGRVWLTTPNATTSLAGTIAVYSHDEDGLQGIAIDADFETNRWVYVYYAPPLNTPPGDAPSNAADAAAFEPFKGYNRLSRMKLTASGTLDLSTEQEILRVPADRGICCHAGGEIDFDAEGNLYLSTGDDTNPFESEGYTPIDERATRNPAFDAQRSSANTNDLRGKLLRIKVNADGSYSSPAGNMFPTGTAGTRPEIYAMGFRNPFRFAVDEATGWIYLGDYGPDAGAAHPDRGPAGQVEFNLIKAPGNYGWPYCHGKNVAYNDFDFATSTSGAKFNCAAPKNESPRNTGLVDLPPAQPAWISYDNCSLPEFGCGSESPMGGETYRFDPANPSETKFPEYFNGKNFAYEFGRGWIRALTVGADGSLERIEPFLDSFDFKQLINTEFGPDGSLYVLDYGTGFFSGDEHSAVYRIDYVQGRRPPVAVASANRSSGPAPLSVTFSSAGSLDPDGGPLTYAWDLDGDGDTDSTEQNPTHTYQAAGRYTALLRVTDDSGRTANASVNIVAGNTAPTVRIILPAHGALFEYRDTVPYRIEVVDPEDGAIDCARVRLDTSLGHNEHSHGDQNLTGCSGQVTIPAAWEDPTQHSFYVLTASYTDTGAATAGLELTGSAQVVLEHKAQQAEFFDAQSGVQIVNHQAAVGGRRVGFVDAGDWLRFEDLNLSGIDAVSARVGAWAATGMELRLGSPTGQLLATIPVTSTGSGDNHQSQPAVPVTDPGGTNDLYVVFTGGNMDLDQLTFHGPGVPGNASPQGSISADPTTGTGPLTVDFSADLTDPEGKPVSLTWDFGVAGAPTVTTPNASYTYERRGAYTATLTATDGDGERIVRTFPITVVPACDGAPAPSDEFNGTALDYCRWTTIVREDESHYRVRDGRLEIDAVAGDMYAGATDARNLILQDAPDGAWEAVTKVAVPQGEEFEQAGLIVRSNDRNFAKLTLVDIPNQGWRVEFGQNVDGAPVFDEALDRSGALPAAINEQGIWLRIRSNGLSLSGAWSADGQTWTPMGRTRMLGTMPDPKVGVAAFNGNGQAATFDFFRLTEGGELACQTPATPDAGYRMLFNGTAASLAQWRMAGPGSFMLQEDCSILSVGGLGLLYHPDPFESYSLKLEWKMAGDDNAGVFVGFPNPGNDPWVAVNAGHEIQIDATDDPTHTTGAVYGYQAADLAARDAVVNPPGEWNRYEIVVQGDRIQIFLNDVKINDYTDTDPNRMNAPSLIGLQNHGPGDDVFFRNVQIKEVPTPQGAAPTLAVTAPQPGAVVNSDTMTVSGATSGTRVEIRAGGARVEATPSGGAFSAQVPLTMGSNRISVTAFSANGITASEQFTVLSRAFGERVGGLSDPTGDDNGPGSYRYPTNPVFQPGGFDLTGMEVYTDGDQVRFVTKVNGNVVNPWGGDQISHQRINIYVGAGAGNPTAALPGTNMNTATPWNAAIVIDGRFDTAGVFAPDGTRVARGTLFAIPQTREIGITVPRSALGDLNLAGARYGTAMFINGELGEGLGYIRPAYDPAYWENPPEGMPWIKEWRIGGGAGMWNDTPTHDTDTRDPNALDVIVGPGQTQAAVLDWTAGAPTRLPMLGLERDDTIAPTVTVTLDPAQPDGANGAYNSQVTVRLQGADDRAGAVALEYRLDGGEWTAFADPFVVRTAGEHTVQYRGTDAAGNVSTVGSVSFRIDPGDSTKPTVTARLSPADPNGRNGTYRSPVTIILDGTDDRPGTVRLEYRLDGGAWTPYTTPVVVAADGRHTIEYRATDTAGNTSAVGTATFEIKRPRADKPTVKVLGGRDIKDITRRGLRVAVTCPLECRASARLRVSRRIARRLDGAGRVIGHSDSRVIRAGRTNTLVVRLDRGVRRDIVRLMRRAGMRRLSAVLVTRIRTASGAETVERRLRLRR